MSPSYRTQIGGPSGQIMNTRWSQILLAQQGGDDQRRQALGAITEQYWKPVYSFLRGKGFDNERAKDLTQGFFTDVILGRELVRRVDPAQGKFRSYLLASLGNYVNDFRRKQSAAARKPDKALVSLEGAEAGRYVPAPAGEMPEEAFNRAWASSLLAGVLEELESNCRQSGQTRHWQVFSDRHLRPISEGVPPIPYAEICEARGIDTPTQATTMNVTVKRKFEAILLRRVRLLVQTDEQVREEINDLMRILAGRGAGIALA